VQFIFNINNKPFDLSFVQVTQNDNTCRIFAPFLLHFASIIQLVCWCVSNFQFTLLRYVKIDAKLPTVYCLLTYFYNL